MSHVKDGLSLDIEYIDLGKIGYERALELQEETLKEVQAGHRPNTVFLLEHEPVFSLTRKPGVVDHLLASEAILAQERIEVVHTNRGGDITYHGPGQLVIYPILRLNDFKLNLRNYVSLIEQSIIDTCQAYGIDAHRDVCAVGVWVGGTLDPDTGHACDTGGKKIAAIGIRVRKWVSMHGLALNVNPNMKHFKLIVPCGLNRPVTSMSQELNNLEPKMDQVKAQWKICFENLLALPIDERPQKPEGR